MSVELVGDSYEPDGSSAAANSITVGGAAQQHTLDPYGDQDWVSFTVADGLTYRVVAGAAGQPDESTVVTLFDSDGTTEIGGGSPDWPVDYEADANKTIYARITGYFADEGAEYEVSVSVISDAYEPDDSYKAAGSVTVNGAVQERNLLPSDESDWVELQVTRGWKYTIRTGPGDPVQDTDTILELYESDGITEIAYNDDDDGSYSRIDYIADVDATLYVRVTGQWWSDSTYTFWVTAVPVPIIEITESVDFGTVVVGDSLQRTITVSNVGAAPLTIGDVVLEGAGFSITSGNPSGEEIGADESREVVVTYSPTVAYSGPPDPVKHSWTSTIAQYNYVGGSLYSISLFTGFENLGGGGDLDWHVRVGGSDSYGANPVVAGGKYIVEVVESYGTADGWVEVLEPVTQNFELTDLLGSFLSCTYIRVPDGSLQIASDDEREPTVSTGLFGTGGEAASPNTAPVALADSYTMAENTPLTVPAKGVLGNDTDAEDDSLTAHLLTDVSHGTLVLNADGSFLYTPDADFSGTDSFTYKANDGTADSNVVAVTITVTAVDDLPPVISIAGENRFETAVAASLEAYPDGLDDAGARTVVIATGRNWPDALGGSSLAGALDGPILLVDTNAVPAEVTAEITRLDADKAIIRGGTAAVGPNVESALKAQLGSSDVTRIDGANRYETADKIAAEVIELAGASYDGTAFVATGAKFPDALGAAPLAAANAWPLYLANPTTGLSAATKAAMDGVDTVLVLGGTAVVSPDVETYLDDTYGDANVTRLAGADRYETAVKVATWGVDHAGLGWNRVAIATGINFPDALAGGVLQGRVGSVMLLTRPDALNTYTSAALSAHKADITTVTFFGGLGALPQVVRDQVSDALE